MTSGTIRGGEGGSDFKKMQDIFGQICEKRSSIVMEGADLMSGRGFGMPLDRWRFSAYGRGRNSRSVCLCLWGCEGGSSRYYLCIGRL